jgi:hypothetical protein
MDSAGHVALDQIPPLSLADYCLDQAIDEMELDFTAPCMSSDSLISVHFKSSFPILQALLERPGSTPSAASILFNSGAFASFLDFAFARRNCLHLTSLTHPIQCQGFEGTLAKSGGIHTCWPRGYIQFPAENNHLQSFSFSLLVTTLALANIILGFPWLSKNQIFVGGCPRCLLVPK